MMRKESGEIGEWENWGVACGKVRKLYCGLWIVDCSIKCDFGNGEIRERIDAMRRRGRKRNRFHI